MNLRDNNAHHLFGLTIMALVQWNITVPEQYPEVAPQFEVGSSNFPGEFD